MTKNQIKIGMDIQSTLDTIDLCQCILDLCLRSIEVKQDAPATSEILLQIALEHSRALTRGNK
jgi:hypothetical protein